MAFTFALSERLSSNISIHRLKLKSLKYVVCNPSADFTFNYICFVLTFTLSYQLSRSVTVYQLLAVISLKIYFLAVFTLSLSCRLSKKISAYQPQTNNSSIIFSSSVLTFTLSYKALLSSIIFFLTVLFLRLSCGSWRKISDYRLSADSFFHNFFAPSH